jgi:hypothetical protein
MVNDKIRMVCPTCAGTVGYPTINRPFGPDAEIVTNSLPLASTLWGPSGTPWESGYTGSDIAETTSVFDPVPMDFEYAEASRAPVAAAESFQAGPSSASQQSQQHSPVGKQPVPPSGEFVLYCLIGKSIGTHPFHSNNLQTALGQTKRVKVQVAACRDAVQRAPEAFEVADFEIRLEYAARVHRLVRDRNGSIPDAAIVMLYNDWALQNPSQKPAGEPVHVKPLWPDRLIESLGPQTVDGSFLQNKQFVVPEVWTTTQLKYATQAVTRYVFALTKAPNDPNLLPCEMFEQASICKCV